MQNNYAFITPEADYVLIQNPDYHKSVFVHARFETDLETVIDSLELAGREEGRYQEDLSIEYDPDTDVFFDKDSPFPYFLELTKVDVCLWMQFEVLEFLGVIPDA